jgi:hypothetical protein
VANVDVGSIPASVVEGLLIKAIPVFSRMLGFLFAQVIDKGWDWRLILIKKLALLWEGV